MPRRICRPSDPRRAGGYTYYGEAEKALLAHQQRLLPVGLAQDCVLTRDLAKDVAITYDDVTLPAGRLADRLRAEQDAAFEVR